MSGITFTGLASGLDTASIVKQLVEIKRAPIYRLEANKKMFESQISALNTMKTKLLALQTAAQQLDTVGEFSSLTTSSSNEDLLTATATEDAAAGTYDITVKTLATSQKEVSQGYASTVSSVGEGTISITVDGETTDLALSGVTTIEALKNQINDNVDGVSASIINDGSGTDSYHLVLTSTEAGSAGSFSLDMSGLSGGTTPVFENKQVATDATLTVDGVDVIASSNNASDVISGLTLHLEDFDPDSKVTLEVSVDAAEMSETVKGMVDAYNDLMSYIDTQTKSEGELRGNPTARSVKSNMQNIFISSLEDGLGDISSFFQVGISLGSASQLEWDEDKFAEAIEDDFGGVRDFFVEREGNVGKMYMIDTAIENLTDSIDGLFKISTDALDKKIDYADQSILRYERSVESYQVTMERKYTAMESMLAQLQAQGNYLMGALNSG